MNGATPALPSYAFVVLTGTFRVLSTKHSYCRGYQTQRGSRNNYFYMYAEITIISPIISIYTIRLGKNCQSKRETTVRIRTPVSERNLQMQKFTKICFRTLKLETTTVRIRTPVTERNLQCRNLQKLVSEL